MRDVVIVGGGPVGILLGCLLAVRGVDVEVLERRSEPSMRSRAIGIHPPSLGTLAQIGVADDLIARAVRINGGVVRCDGRTLGRLSFAEAAARYPFVVALPQYETEALLRARFEQLRPGGLRQGVAVRGVREVGDHVEISADVADGAGVAGVADGVDVADLAEGADGADGADCADGVDVADVADVANVATIHARYVVGADGARSVVRQAVRLGWAARGREETYLMADFVEAEAEAEAEADAEADAEAEAEADAGSEAVLYFERGGVVESFPLPNGRRRWVAMTDGLLSGATSADLARIIRDRTGVVLPPSTDPPSAFSVRQRLADRMVAGRITLVGDAAHEISPIGGQGMNLGWLDAVALAPALARALADPNAAAPALAAFDRRRRRSARRAIRQAGFNMAMGRPAGGLRLFSRNVLVRALAMPPTRGILARAFTMRWL